MILAVSPLSPGLSLLFFSGQSETALMHSWVLEGVKVLFVFCKDVNQTEDIDWARRTANSSGV